MAASLAAFGRLTLLIWNAPAVTTSFAVSIGLFIVAGLAWRLPEGANTDR